MKYELCLGFVNHILKDFSVDVTPLLKNELISLGRIACSIDTALDRLNSEQKELLYWEFPEFYKSLEYCEDAGDFQTKAEHFIRIHFPFTTFHPDYKVLFGLLNDCRDLGISTYLHQFSLQMIHSGLAKSRAMNYSEIAGVLKTEGQHAVHFLLVYLDRKALLKDLKNRDSLQHYLESLEQLLNLADDLADVKKDHKSAIISLEPGIRITAFFIRKLAVQFIKTLFTHPLLFPKHLAGFTFSYCMLYFKIRRTNAFHTEAA